MPEVEIMKYNGLVIRIRSDDEELLKEKEMFINVLNTMLEFNYSKFSYSEIKITIDDDDFRFDCMFDFEYVNFDLVLDASNLPDNVKFHMKIFGDIKPISSENRITIFHFEFDERGDKARIYDSYKMFDILPEWMVYRAIKDKDNKFIKWLISSYPDDVKKPNYLCKTIEHDNAEAFHLIEEIVKDMIEDDSHSLSLLIHNTEFYNRPEYAEYIINHYLEE
jgi:hypothetical protein